MPNKTIYINEIETRCRFEEEKVADDFNSLHKSTFSSNYPMYQSDSYSTPRTFDGADDIANYTSFKIRSMNINDNWQNDDNQWYYNDTEWNNVSD